MEILVAIGLLYWLWPVIIVSLMIIDTIIRSVYFWIVVGLIILGYLFIYNKDNKNKK
jgi:hypothetical protein